MIIHSIVIVSLSLLILLLFFSRRKKTVKPVAKQPEPERRNPFHRCPLCGEGLDRGERIHSKAYSMDEGKLMYIHGCPRCFQTTNPQKRHCPVCKKRLGQEDFLVGKMWQKTGKTRLHISGCNLCTRIKF